MILNLKQVRFKRQIEGSEGETVTVKVAAVKSTFTAGDIGQFTAHSK